MHTEAERLLGELMLLRANDALEQKDQPGSSMESLSSENHRMAFIAKNIGTVLVKECLMRSRVSDEDIRSSIGRIAEVPSSSIHSMPLLWQNCGRVFLKAIL
jgi:hypothetical protein